MALHTRVYRVLAAVGIGEWTREVGTKRDENSRMPTRLCNLKAMGQRRQKHKKKTRLAGMKLILENTMSIHFFKT